MAEPKRDATELQLEMAARRGDLRAKVGELREAFRQRLSIRAQLRAHPRIALGAVLLLSVPLIAVAALATFAVRARARRTQRWHGFRRALRG